MSSALSDSIALAARLAMAAVFLSSGTGNLLALSGTEAFMH